MVGATPQLATAVWVGTADNTSAIFNEWGGNMFGSNTPAKIWKDVLDTELEGEEFENFAEASPVYWGVSPYSGGTSMGGYYSSPSTTYSSGSGTGTGTSTGTGQSASTSRSQTQSGYTAPQSQVVEQAPAPAYTSAPAPAPSSEPAPATQQDTAPADELRDAVDSVIGQVEEALQ